MKKSEESLVQLIARMPRAVRDEVKRLQDEVASLKKDAEHRGSPTSRLVVFKRHGDYTPLDEDARVRFYPVIGQRNSERDYVELSVDFSYNSEKYASVCVRTGHGRVLVLPQGANTCTLRTGDL